MVVVAPWGLSGHGVVVAGAGERRLVARGAWLRADSGRTSGPRSAGVDERARELLVVMVEQGAWTAFARFPYPWGGPRRPGTRDCHCALSAGQSIINSRGVSLEFRGFAVARTRPGRVPPLV